MKITQCVGLKVCLGGLLLSALTQVGAVEPPAQVFGLWEFNDDDDAPLTRMLSGIDFLPDPVGIEALGLSDSFEVTAPNSSGDVRTVSTQLLQAHNPDTGAQLLRYTFVTASGTYPDPTSSTGQSTTYICGFDEAPVLPQQDEFPCAERFGFGAANVGNTRLLIVGDSLIGAYFNASDGFVDVSRFRVHAFNLRNGNQRWTRTFRLVDSAGWELALPLCAVGDFLNGDSDDEVRIVQQREPGGGVIEYRYRYYDAKFGNFIKSVTFDVPEP